MLTVFSLLMLTASAIRPFELKQSVHELIGLMASAFAVTWQLLEYPLVSKLALNANVAISSATLLGVLVVSVSALLVVLAWSWEIGSPVMVVVLASASVLVLTAQTSALVLTALELQSYAAYATVALGCMPAYRQLSASIYLVMGALATAGFVIGWAMLFHVGELALARLPSLHQAGQLSQVVGLLVKLGCFPFGFWLPLAYGGLGWAALGMVAVLPQIPLAVQVWILTPDWLAPVYLLSGASVMIGSLMSANTPYVRSLLAFSSMAHAGYLLSGSALNLCPILLYSFTYTLVLTLLCLGLSGWALQPVLRLSGLRGGANVYVLLATAVQLSALNLGGLPPLLGFFAKSYILLGGVGLTNSLLQPTLLVGLGALGLVAYLRLTLAAVGYPQTTSYLVQAKAETPSSSSLALLLGLTLLSQLITEWLSLSLLY